MATTLNRRLLVFSIILLLGGGVAWACSWYEPEDYSVFNATYFVGKQGDAFFYSSYFEEFPSELIQEGDNIIDNNQRYHNRLRKDWRVYLGPKADTLLDGKLLWATAGEVDTVQAYLNGKYPVIPRGYTVATFASLPKKKLKQFLAYLVLAKSCEKFADRQPPDTWSDKPDSISFEPGLPEKLGKALQQEKNSFLKERFWFQLIRYHYFNDKFSTARDSSGINLQHPIMRLFNAYSAKFPKDLTWYRALGYLAGYAYHHGDYAQANYWYSRGYDYATAMKIPSVWSFHPQEEKDWHATLALATNAQEKITLWQMLGMEADKERAIREIYKLDPHSEKLDLLLCGLINDSETGGKLVPDSIGGDAEVSLVDSIARAGNTSKPFLWNLAAGYQHYLWADYPATEKFYLLAKRQLPANDTLIQAQYRLLQVLLDIRRIKVLDAGTENRLIEPLTWLANLRDDKEKVEGLPYNPALRQVTEALSERYLAQNQQLRLECFADSTRFYAEPKLIDSLRQLMQKVNKTAYERVMLRYYSHDLIDLNYQQAVLATYAENYLEAIRWMQAAGKAGEAELPANPFSSRLNDCHDCDAAAPTKQHYTSLTFVKALRVIHNEIVKGKNVYRNALLLAGAYYNITHYGNARSFYIDAVNHSDVYQPEDLPVPFLNIFTSPALAHKYYLLALSKATTNEERARCIFMLSKCARNDDFNHAIIAYDSTDMWQNWPKIPADTTYFDQLKNRYSNTAYYHEVLAECGWFRDYVQNPRKK